MRTLIISPMLASRAGSFYHFPIGLAYLSGALKAAGCDVVCLNPNHSDVPLNEQVVAALKEHAPQIVMSGGLSPNANMVAAFFAEAKAYDPVIVTVAGGG